MSDREPLQYKVMHEDEGRVETVTVQTDDPRYDEVKAKLESLPE